MSDVAPTVRPPSRVWVAPETWPPAPESFIPPDGWQPDPSWPPPPAGHKFWTLTARGRRRRICQVGGLVTALVWFAACFVVITPRIPAALSALNTIIPQLPP
jgi:hypothetical protein